jgi:phospholipid/cholesterol/gamma-HCH transport system substrate-binding protein
MSVSVARAAGVGVFVLGGLLLFAVGLFMIGDRQMAFADKFVIYTEFAKITGLQPGAIVRVSGARAGSVTRIEPPPGPSGKFRVRLEVSEELHQLVRTDSLASIDTEGLVGGSFLAISTGTEQNPQAPPESTIPGREPFEISDLLTRMSDTIAKVNGAIDAMQGDLQHAVVAVGDTVDNANELINTVSGDVKRMAAAGSRITNDVADLAEGVREGRGTIGKLMRSDELYGRITSIAASAEQIATDTRQVVQKARETLEGFQSSDGPVSEVTTGLKQTLEDARTAVAGVSENMEALKHNFLLRGFFNRRGYFDLADISPAEYRKGALTKGNRRPVRIWLRDKVLFDQAAPSVAVERLSATGKARLDSAVAPFLDKLADGVLMVEGFSQPGTQDEQYLTSRTKAALVRNYLIGKFHLDPQATGIMPLGAGSSGSPDGDRWDGIAVTIFLEQSQLN